MGAAIVFIAVQTALISSYLLPDDTSPSPSLVGLAIQYTLLIPIYLNWVVKLYADMEMYFGACERISYYIEQNCYHEREDSMESCKYTNLQFTTAHNRGVGLMYLLFSHLFMLWKMSHCQHPGRSTGTSSSEAFL